MLFFNKKPRKTFFKKEFPLFALITVFISALSMLFLLFSANMSNNKNNQNNLKKDARNISSIITESFEYTNRINSHLGQVIATNGASDLNFILKTFRESEKIPHRTADLFSWSSLDWVNAKNYQTVNSKVGIRQNPPNMSVRQYTLTAPKNPWTLQLSHPVLGNPSQAWVIPAGTGITDSKNRYLGSIVVGFNIEEFVNRITPRIGKNISFIVLDEKFNIIMQSRDNKLAKDDDFFKKNFSSKKFPLKSSFLKKEIKVNNVRYSYYTKLEKYPYIILTGYNESFLIEQFNNLVLPRIIEFAFITAFFLAILYLFKSRIMALLFVEKLTKKLESANEAKINLIRATSHDLKNYIIGISGISNMILENKKPSEIEKDEDLKLIKIIHDQSAELLHFVEDLLDTNQIESGKFSLKNISDIDINDIIHRIISLTKNSSIEHKVFIKTNLMSDIPHIKGDARRMKQIFSNLVGNALKYSNRDTIIKINTNYLEATKEILIEIIDQGIGMSKKEIEIALSGRGEDIDKSALNKKFDSHGVGLPIVKRLIELHEGRLEIESQKHKGTTMRLYFKEVSKKTSKKLEKEKIAHSFDHKKIVLLAEDNKVNAKITSSILHSANCDVVLAVNGKDAVNAAKKQKFDLIFLDIEMPIMNGYEAAKKIRKKDLETPIIALTSHSDEKSIEEARECGVNRVLDKAAGKKELLDLVFYFFERDEKTKLVK